MIKAILLDCGGVLVAPSTGDWMVSPGFEAILGDDFLATRLPAFRKARNAHLNLIPDAHRMDGEAEECEMVAALYRTVFDEMDIALTNEQIERLARLQTYAADRYTLFDDVLPCLAAWHGRYRLGIVSDAPPSTRRIMASLRVLEWIDAATFSCDLGVLKPDPRIYRATLDKLGVAARDAVFVDDIPQKLRGAQAVGIRSVQMRRPMPPRFVRARLWDGPVVRSLAELDQWLAALR